MKKVCMIFCLALPLASPAQFGNLVNKVKNKVSQRVDSKIDRSIDKSLNKAEGVEPVSSSPQNQDNDEAGGINKKPATLASYSKFDFVAGSKILYFANFDSDETGELPLGWNTSGSGEVVTGSDLPGKWLRLHNPFTYLSSNSAEFGKNYTAEFDLVLQLKSNGWMYPTFTVGFLSASDKLPSDNLFLKTPDQFASVFATIYPEQNNHSRAVLENYIGRNSVFKSEPKTYAELQDYYGKQVHISIQVQSQRFRMWINDVKLFDIPRAVDTGFKMNQVYFNVGLTNYKEEQYGVFISNIKIATGIPDTRHKLLEEGKFSTSGILFDLNSAVIKPESFGVMKEIGTLLKEYSTLKIKIIGHTSSDGDDNANMELSIKRAAAVKKFLEDDYGIPAERIVSEGKGETQPVADNKVNEGRLQNRRVEFIKI